jgi:hypothetical protein
MVCSGGLLVSKARKQIILVAGLFLILVVAVALISTFWPKYEQQFIELGVLGRDGSATGYYPNDNPNLNSGSQVKWFIYTHNHMASSQYITVRVKLLDSTMQGPNDTLHIPSPFASIAEFPVLLHINETQSIPFSWNILDATSQDGSIVIQSLVINGQTVNLNPSVTSASSFCLVFELWVYNQATHDYSFGWESEKGFASASVTMWFNVKL